VGEAARLYFGKDVGQIDLAESAQLAGMIRSPSEYSPFKSKDAAKARRDFVLNRLYEKGVISASELAAAKDQPIVTPQRRSQVVMAPYFIQFVKQQLQELYPENILQSEGLKIFTTLDMTAQVVAEAAVQKGLSDLDKSAASILPKNHPDPLQGALISIQPQTGYIRSMVGGRDFNNTQFNRITQAKRQPGSTFKPFVYLTAFDPQRSKKLTYPSAYIDDVHFTIESGGKQWTPDNYDKKEHGRVTLRSALENSYNIATAKLALDAGLEEVVQTARDAGLTSDLQAVPSIALGSFEVTPMELASAYTIFANNGIRALPVSIIQVVDKSNQVLQRKVIEVHKKFDAGPVYLTTNVLKGVIDHGTAASARKMGFTGIAAGKTGTTSNYKDAWFVGFTPSILTLVWVGYDDNATMNLSGGRAALPIWTTYMKQTAGESQEDFSPPPGVVLVKVDPATGLLSGKNCPEGAFEPFIEGHEPSKTCD
jgi:penicillin-binding protein 1B